MQIQQKLRRTSKLDYHDIEEARLLMILNHVMNGNGSPEFISDGEKYILMGTLIDQWGDCVCLTELGKVFLCELVFRSFDNYQGDE
jgi:hypothetical protein